MGVAATVATGSEWAERRDVSRRWLRPPPDDVFLRLVCLPHAGGGAGAFNGWRRYLPSKIGLVPLSLRGRDDHRAGSRLDVRAYVDALLEDIEPLGDGPLALYGHSLGAVMAFELARALRRAGRRLPVILFVSGRRAPDRPLRDPMLCELPDAQLLRRVGLMGGTAARVLAKPAWSQRLLATLRGELEISDRYRYDDEPPLACPIIAFIGADDPAVPWSDWEAWRRHTSIRFAGYVLPGRHIFAPSEQRLVVSHVVDHLRQDVGVLNTVRSPAP
jgi:medium-chain acyl-[acyl-carrier-protein] hydrolase